MEHVMSSNIKSIEVNDTIGKKLQFDSSNSLDNNTIKYTLYIVTLSLRVSKILDIHYSEV